ncbi:MAG: hypothetical protein IPO27_13530 [Bacteroidetes bacterium]|nr:hypothetical protein [Bacteroidota bacterium]
MENLIIAFISVTAIGFGVTIFFISNLLKEQKLTNEKLTSNKEVFINIKTQLEKLEVVEKEHKTLSKEGFTQIENALKETIKLD